jgi:signal transduction histidine kinase
MTREAQAAANRELIMLVNNAISESSAQYARLEREEAAGRARDLEAALAQLGEIERRRGALIREAVHDLGGNIQAVTSAASLLGVTDIPEDERRIFSEMLKRGVGTLRTMLGDLMKLARLEAGEEQRNVALFDAAAVLTELCKVSQPLADQRRLSLSIEGPASLPVEGDADKVHRIAQNLVINALKYTQVGGVTVSWGEEGTEKWWLKVEDTGPGLLSGPGAPMLKALKEATASARDSDQKALENQGETEHVLPDSAPGETDFLPARQQPGEGIGLSIVKRLCELLDASLELSSSPETGTIFRVLIPRRYEQ